MFVRCAVPLRKSVKDFQCLTLFNVINITQPPVHYSSEHLKKLIEKNLRNKRPINKLTNSFSFASEFFMKLLSLLYFPESCFFFPPYSPSRITLLSALLSFLPYSLFLLSLLSKPVKRRFP